jgi:signal transduction histidine kinase
MIDTGQLLERFRLLSRDIQNGLQSSQKQLESLKTIAQRNEIEKLSNTLIQITDAWQDFSGWILVSTIDNIAEARSNCAPARVDVISKILRSKNRRLNDLANSGVRIDTTESSSQVVETFIPYFEQLLDLLFSNAIKYSPNAGNIEVATNRTSNGVTISISSLGPVVLKAEISQLGEKGFRSENARKKEVSGQGYGLFNCLMLAKLIGAKIEFRPESKANFEIGGTPYAVFKVLLRIPDSPPSVSDTV